MGRIAPQPGPQWDFLASPADIAVYGGAAGGGKSWALLVEPLRHVRTVPGFRGVIFRRTYPEITNSGGLWDQSAEIYPKFGGVPRQGNLDWTFPPHGNVISFRHLQHEANKYQWQGSEVPYFGFDELSHFTESQFTYVALSRGRSTCGVRPYVRATTNPDPGWVKDFLAPWVDKEFPHPAGSGEIRRFIRDQGKLVWVDAGHPDAKSLSFVRASIYDNKVLLSRNPEYLASLKALLPVERARLLDGDWDVRREGLVYPDFGSTVVDDPGDGIRAQQPDVGGIDFGFSNPFAAVWGHLDHDGCLWVTGCRYVRQCTLPVHAEALPKGVRYWCDPAQPESRVELRNAAHDAIPCVHLSARGAGGEKRTPILHGIDLVTERIRTGRLKVVRSACMPLIREMGLYHYDPEKRSDNPVDDDNHACLAAGTIVSTDRGGMPIEWVNPGDRVWTRDGWRNVAWAGKTGYKPIYRLMMTDGNILRGTADHPVWVQDKGWTRLDALRYGDALDTVEYSIPLARFQACPPSQRRSFSTEWCSAGIPSLSVEATGCTLPVSAGIDCMRLSGSIITDPFPMGTTSITSTATRSTTTLPTWLASTVASISWPTVRRSAKPNGIDAGHRLIEFATWLRSGTDPRPGEPGTESLARRAGPVASLWQRLVSIARSLSRLVITGGGRDTAPVNAECTRGSPGAMTTNRGRAPFAARRSRSIDTPSNPPARVLVVGFTDERLSEPVYNLTVDGTPEFYANGVLVHNCDALRYLIVGLDRGKQAPPPAPLVPTPEPARPIDDDDERMWR